LTHPSDHSLTDLAHSLAERLLAQHRCLATAESCTGGWIGKVCTDLPGSSGWFAGGLITYTNAAKTGLLDVAATMLASHGAVSEPIALAMAQGAQQSLAADYAIAVTGIAGPDGGSAEQPVGTVWIAWAGPDGITAQVFTFAGSRDAVRRQTVAAALEGLLQQLEL